jgi:hypothetical protein
MNCGEGPGDDPETAALRPSRVSGFIVATIVHSNLASRRECSGPTIAVVSREVK